MEDELEDQSHLHLSLVECAGILPSTTVFFSEPLPDFVGVPAQRRHDRLGWFGRAKAAVDGCDLIFLDPDNGLEVPSVSLSSRTAGKYVTVAEIGDLVAMGAGIVYYQHCDRSPWEVQRARISNRLQAGIDQQIAIRSVRFGAFGSRAFICILPQSDIGSRMERGLVHFRRRIAAWSGNRYFRID